MLILQPQNLQWIRSFDDDPNDVCVHGDVDFRIGTTIVLSTSEATGLTLSASALHLLRTLEREHSKDTPVADFLFACCGFTVYDLEEEPDVHIVECLSGANVEILHRPRGSQVVVRMGGGAELVVPWAEWEKGVFSFADSISAFYASCAAKRIPDKHDYAGWMKFKQEWARRRGRPLELTAALTQVEPQRRGTLNVVPSRGHQSG